MPRRTRHRTHRRRRTSRRHGGAHTWGSRASQAGKWAGLAGVAAASIYGAHRLTGKNSKQLNQDLKDLGIKMRNARGTRALEKLGLR